jgi:glycosyltransferase involved in cell wall biosynthesis
MKIVVVNTPVFKVPVRGYAGLEVIAYECAKGLAALGHDVKLIAADGSTCPGVEVVPVGPAMRVSEEQAYGGFPEVKDDRGNVLREAHRGYWQHLKEADAVVDHSWQKYAYLLKQEGVLKAPVLGVMHAPVDTMYPPPPGVDTPCTVCISEDQAAHYRALYNADARVCYNGVDTEFYKPLGLPRSSRFLFLARFSYIKGADLAIRACSEAGVGLDLVGDTQITHEPEYFQMCLNLVNEANAKANDTGLPTIRMVGPATRGECVRWFSQAHALLHPVQRFREPLGLAPLEAQLCGCPVISWRNGAMSETIKQGRTGVLVHSLEELTETIRSFANTDPLGDWWRNPVMRNECREWASRWSVETMTKRYEELCREAVETGGW